MNNPSCSCCWNSAVPARPRPSVCRGKRQGFPAAFYLVSLRSGYDFKQLFTISESYDRNRQDYYQALQSVRNNNLDMTSWLEYFCKALETQMQEIQRKGSQAMKLDVLVLEHPLSERQKQALESLMASEKDFTIQEYESLCPGINRRSLQRDLADLIEKGIITQEGIKKAARYRLNRHG